MYENFKLSHCQSFSYRSNDTKHDSMLPWFPYTSETLKLIKNSIHFELFSFTRVKMKFRERKKYTHFSTAHVMMQKCE